MRAANVLVFDEYCQSGSNSNPGYYTDQSLNDRLGMFDQLALMAVVDNVSGAGTNFKVSIDHSADGRIWLPKSTSAEIGSSSAISPSATQQEAHFGSDAGTTPSLGHVRLHIDLGSTSAAHVRVFVTGRNWGGR